MKKALICAALATLGIVSCKKDDDQVVIEQEVKDINEQNANDDKAIAKYLDEHYLDKLGRIMAFSTTSTDDDAFPKLSALNPKILPSGVVVISRDGAQPTPGTTIGESDIIRLMHTTTTLKSKVENNAVTYTEGMFVSTLQSTGVPQVDPQFYYVTPEVVKASGKPKSYFEIEGFQEGLKYFKSFDKPDSDSYNLQGVIIVPSRAAFARDDHYRYAQVSWRNQSFVFNFQVYKTTPRK